VKILIVGGGPVGLAAALALRRHCATADVSVLEAAAREQQSFGDRNIGLSGASWRFLAQLGVTVADAQRAAIRDVEVSQQGVFGLLRLTASDIEASELGAASPYPALKTALDDAVARAGIEVMYGARATAVHHEANRAVVKLATGERLVADCVALADGAGTDLLPELKRIERDSGQIAVITRVSASHPRAGVAFERFTAGGALALISRADRSLTVVWARARDQAERLLQTDDASFADELNRAFGRTLGRLDVVAARSSYPLTWRVIEPRASGAVVALGNAAQALHPVAAQGLNLGLRDARDFAETLFARDAAPGIAARLQRYARLRGPDRVARIGFSGVLAYGFDRGGWLADVPRGLALTAVQLLPPLRREITRRLAAQ